MHACSVVHISSPERSFHIFYQLAAGASDEERAAWRLPPASAALAPGSFAYLSMSSCTSIPDADNAAEYQVGGRQAGGRAGAGRDAATARHS